MNSSPLSFSVRQLAYAIQMLMLGMPVCWAGHGTASLPVSVTVMPTCLIAPPQAMPLDTQASSGAMAGLLNCGAGQSAVVLLSAQPLLFQLNTSSTLSAASLSVSTLERSVRPQAETGSVVANEPLSQSVQVEPLDLAQPSKDQEKVQWQIISF